MYSKTIMFALGASVLAILAASAPIEQSFATSNGIGLNGPHYNLNLIGQKSTNCPQTDSSGGNVIFVNLNGGSDIYLQQGPTFYVLDNNACGDKSASFQLPAPGTYTIMARVEGTPGGNGVLTTCGIDSTGATICSLNQNVTIGTRSNGNKFQDVTAALTTVCYVPTGTTTVTCVPIFSTAFQNYLWQYDNQGNKVLQLRFYPTS